MRNETNMFLRQISAVPTDEVAGLAEELHRDLRRTKSQYLAAVPREHRRLLERITTAYKDALRTRENDWSADQAASIGENVRAEYSSGTPLRTMQQRLGARMTDCSDMRSELHAAHTLQAKQCHVLHDAAKAAERALHEPFRPSLLQRVAWALCCLLLVGLLLLALKAATGRTRRHRLAHRVVEQQSRACLADLGAARLEAALKMLGRVHTLLIEHIETVQEQLDDLAGAFAERASAKFDIARQWRDRSIIQDPADAETFVDDLLTTVDLTVVSAEIQRRRLETGRSILALLDERVTELLRSARPVRNLGEFIEILPEDEALARLGAAAERSLPARIEHHQVAGQVDHGTRFIECCDDHLFELINSKLPSERPDRRVHGTDDNVVRFTHRSIGHYAAQLPFLRGLAAGVPNEQITRAMLWPDAHRLNNGDSLDFEHANSNDKLEDNAEALLLRLLALDLVTRNGGGFWSTTDSSALNGLRHKDLGRGLAAILQRLKEPALERELAVAACNVESALGAEGVVRSLERANFDALPAADRGRFEEIRNVEIKRLKLQMLG